MTSWRDEEFDELYIQAIPYFGIKERTKNGLVPRNKAVKNFDSEKFRNYIASHPYSINRNKLRYKTYLSDAALGNYISGRSKPSARSFLIICEAINEMHRTVYFEPFNPIEFLTFSEVDQND